MNRKELIESLEVYRDGMVDMSNSEVLEVINNLKELDNLKQVYNNFKTYKTTVSDYLKQVEEILERV